MDEVQFDSDYSEEDGASLFLFAGKICLCVRWDWDTTNCLQHTLV